MLWWRGGARARGQDGSEKEALHWASARTGRNGQDKRARASVSVECVDAAPPAWAACADRGKSTAVDGAWRREGGGGRQRGVVELCHFFVSPLPHQTSTNTSMLLATSCHLPTANCRRGVPVVELWSCPACVSLSIHMSLFLCLQSTEYCLVQYASNHSDETGWTSCPPLIDCRWSLAIEEGWWPKADGPTALEKKLDLPRELRWGVVCGGGGGLWSL